MTDTDVALTVPVMFDHDAAKTARRLKGMTTTTLAHHLGVSERTVTRWEAGQGQPDYTQGLRIEALLGLTPGALYVQPVAVGEEDR